MADPQRFEIVGSGSSCERCQALDGRHVLYDLTPLHPHCDCEVKLSYFGEPRERCDHQFGLRHEQSSRYGEDGAGLITSWTIVVYCDDRSIYETDAAVDHGLQPSADFEEILAWAYSELYDDAQDIIAEHCLPCDPPPVPQFVS